jgi:uncharacterized protein YhaN
MSNKLDLISCFIGGYGAFKDKKINFDSRNFILIYGRNEAGKSTLFSFLRGMIAGFPSLKKKTENRYLPLNGGEYGGEVEILYNTKPHTIKKFGKDLSSIDVSGELEKDYLAFTNSIDREHYKAIFGFDLSELISLNLLDDASLNERLFSSFIAGSEDVVSGALKDLDKSKQELIKARSDSKIARLYKEFVVGETKVRELESEVQAREVRVSSLGEIEDGIEQKKSERAGILSKLEELKDQKEASLIFEALKREEKNSSVLSELPVLSGEEEQVYREITLERKLLESKITSVNSKVTELTKIITLKTDKLKFSIWLFLAACLLSFLIAYSFSFNLYLVPGLVMLVGGFFLYSLYQERAYCKSQVSQHQEEGLEISDKLLKLSKHPLAHLLESDVVELKENGQKLKDSLTKIGALKETLRSLKLDPSMVLANNSSHVEELNLNLARVSRELDKLLEERGLIKASIEELSTSSKLQELRLDVQSLMSEIERLLFSWRVDAFSEYLLAEALKKVGESAFKNVSISASDIFSSITLGMYSEVNLGAKGSSVVVKDRAGKTLEPSQLSQGTVEQLYLSLRLALAKVSKDSFGSLPILLDDVLVNFDKERARAILKVLAEMSKENQVLYFTCHEWIRELYEEEVGGGVVECLYGIES